MYERSYGYRYEEVRDLTTVDIAKRIRADIKQAKAEGLLPTRWTYSVRTDHGTSIDVEVRDCPDAWRPCDGSCHYDRCSVRNPDGRYAEPHNVLTDEAEAAKMTLERIHGAYNYDGSEVQVDYFDVRYYGHVEFEDARAYDFRMREKARLEARKANREAGEPCGYYVNYSRDGRQTVHLVVETPEGGKVLACGARTWRGGLGGFSAQPHEVTCSRCAKKEA